jgi:hypothetical protein
VTVFISSHGVALSPTRVGAGPLQIYIANESGRTVSLRVLAPGGSTLLDSGPIDPQTTSQVTIEARDRGSYTLTTGAFSRISPTTLRVGGQRPSADGVLLVP